MKFVRGVCFAWVQRGGIAMVVTYDKIVLESLYSIDCVVLCLGWP